MFVMIDQGCYILHLEILEKLGKSKLTQKLWIIQEISLFSPKLQKLQKIKGIDSKNSIICMDFGKNLFERSWNGNLIRKN